MTENQQLELATHLWGKLSRVNVENLVGMLRGFHLSVSRGHVALIDNKLYVTHAGLLYIARRSRCAGILVKPVHRFCDLPSQRWAFVATVFRSKSCRGFVGYGEADPSNVSPLVRGAEMRVAETRAVNRALRKAYGVGLCSVEELGARIHADNDSTASDRIPPRPAGGSGSNGRKVRDQLCQIIRQHQLDPNLVKAYAVDYCGVKNLKDASREQIENFVKELSEWAEKDRNALLCQLNSYLRSKEGAA